MQEQNPSLRITCPWCGRPQTMPAKKGYQRCRQCKNPFIWDQSQGKPIIASPQIAPISKPESKNTSTPTPPQQAAGPGKPNIGRRLGLYIAVMALACLCGVAIWFYSLPSKEPLAPEDTASKSALDEISKQLKALSE